MPERGGTFPVTGGAGPRITANTCATGARRPRPPRLPAAFGYDWTSPVRWGYRREPVTWHRLVRQALEMVAPWLQCRGIRITPQVGLTAGAVPADSKLLSSMVNCILHVIDRLPCQATAGIAVWAADDEVAVSIYGPPTPAVRTTLADNAPAPPRLALASQALAECGGRLAADSRRNCVVMRIPQRAPQASKRLARHEAAVL